MGTILLVEDNDDLRAMLAEILQLEGWQVVAVKGRGEALKTARRVRVDIVLTDVILVQSTGVELERAFKDDPLLGHTPFVFMTGFGPHVEAVGSDRTLLKPFAVSDLQEMLQRARTSSEPH